MSGRSNVGMTLAALILTAVGGGGNAAATPVLLWDNPRRPADSAQLLATSGTVLRYRLIATSSLVSPRLTIKDDVTDEETTFSLSFDTTIDGRRLACSDPSPVSPVWQAKTTIAENQLCGKLPPNVVVGKTRVVLIYWRHADRNPPNALYDFNQNPGSDAIWTTR